MIWFNNFDNLVKLIINRTTNLSLTRVVQHSVVGRSRFIHFFVGYRFIHNQFFRLKRVDKMVKYAKKDRVDKMVFLMHILPFYPRCDCLEVTMF